jgi:spermidine synthase
MICLHRTPTPRGEVTITLDQATSFVSYRKAGLVQTQVDGKGHNLSPFVAKAVELLKRDGVRRVLVLGHGGGAASSLLYKRGVDVVSIDSDECAEGLGRLFFRAPPKLSVIIADAAHYVATATPASFDAVLIDFQDAAATPRAYLTASFWKNIVTLLRPPAVTVVHIDSALRQGPDWDVFRRVRASVGLDSIALSEPFPGGDRLLSSQHHQ